jgi:hypothetical protein
LEAGSGETHGRALQQGEAVLACCSLLLFSRTSFMGFSLTMFMSNCHGDPSKNEDIIFGGLKVCEK